MAKYDRNLMTPLSPSDISENVVYGNTLSEVNSFKSYIRALKYSKGQADLINRNLDPIPYVVLSAILDLLIYGLRGESNKTLILTSLSFDLMMFLIGIICFGTACSNEVCSEGNGLEALEEKLKVFYWDINQKFIFIVILLTPLNIMSNFRDSGNQSWYISLLIWMNVVAMGMYASRMSILIQRTHFIQTFICKSMVSTNVSVYCVDPDDDGKTALVLNMKARHKLRNQGNCFLVVSLLGVFIWSSLSIFVVMCVERNDYYLLNISLLSCVIVMCGSSVFSDLAESCSSVIVKRRVQRSRLLDNENGGNLTTEAVQKLSVSSSECDGTTGALRNNSVINVTPVSCQAEDNMEMERQSDGMTDGMTSIYSVRLLGVNLHGLFYKNITMSAISALSILLVVSRIVSFIKVSNSC